jgi:predicted NBD/HSP70 family sugar kinase
VVSRTVLVVDVGGSHVKALLAGEQEPRKFESGPTLTPRQMVDGVRTLVADWPHDAVSVGIPAPVRAGKAVSEPVNLGRGWVGFDFEGAFGSPTKVVNDAAMQALGSYEGGRMLFLGLGTGLGSTLILDGVIQPLELGHLPYRKKTFEEYIGSRALERRGKKRWRDDVADVVARLSAALEPDYIVIGGSGVKELEVLPENSRRGANANAFVGGLRLWDDEWQPQPGTDGRPR